LTTDQGGKKEDTGKRHRVLFLDCRGTKRLEGGSVGEDDLVFVRLIGECQNVTLTKNESKLMFSRREISGKIWGKERAKIKAIRDGIKDNQLRGEGEDQKHTQSLLMEREGTEW